MSGRYLIITQILLMGSLVCGVLEKPDQPKIRPRKRGKLFPHNKQSQIDLRESSSVCSQKRNIVKYSGVKTVKSMINQRHSANHRSSASSVSNDDEFLKKEETRGRRTKRKTNPVNKKKTSWMNEEEGVAPPPCLLQSDDDAYSSGSHESEALSSHHEWSDSLRAHASEGWGEWGGNSALLRIARGEDELIGIQPTLGRVGRKIRQENRRAASPIWSSIFDAR